MSVLAVENFDEQFCGLLSSEQKNCMLEAYFSEKAIFGEMQKGVNYYFIEENGENVGYLSYYVEEDYIHLSALYLIKNEREKEAVRSVVRFVAMSACENDVGAIELFIDMKNFPFISFFETMGFEVCRMESLDSGCGFMRDGYTIRKNVGAARTVLLYIERDDEYLLIHRTKCDVNFGKYMGVGGHIESGETSVCAAVREAFEETGLRVEKLKYCGKLYFYIDENANDVELSYLYKTDSFSGELKKVCPEGSLSWVKKKDVFSLNIWEGDRIFLPEMEKDACFELDLFYEKDELKKYNFRKV